MCECTLKHVCVSQVPIKQSSCTLGIVFFGTVLICGGVIAVWSARDTATVLVPVRYLARQASVHVAELVDTLSVKAGTTLAFCCLLAGSNRLRVSDLVFSPSTPAQLSARAAVEQFMFVLGNVMVNTTSPLQQVCRCCGVVPAWVWVCVCVRVHLLQ